MSSKTERLSITGMHCAACEKSITRQLLKEGVRVKSIDHRSGEAVVTSDGVAADRIVAAIARAGYRLSDATPAAPVKSTTRVERKNAAAPAASGSVSMLAKTGSTLSTVLVNGLLVLVILLVVQTVLALGLYPLLPGYVPQHFWLFLYLGLAVVVNLIALWHQRSYQRDVSCMTGMMVGMTIGMTTGFLIGAIIGLTNGMFTGSVVGTLTGIVAGVYAGRCCGTMGVMEGMMAGLMSGTMGAMLTVMMVTDHVLWFLPFLFVVCIAILIGLLRVVEEERGESPARPWPMAAMLAIGFAAILLLSIVMVLAPKGAY